jgi:hypothetical protein
VGWNEDDYLKFLNEVLPELFQEISLAIHDGAPPHYVQNAAQEIRKNRRILNRVRLSWTRTEVCIPNDGRHFEQLP